MNTSDTPVLMRAAMAAVRDCAKQMETEAENLLLALPDLSMDEKLRPTVLGLSGGLKDTASRVVFELALLQPQIDAGQVDAAAVVQRLSNLDSTLMTALDGSTDVASQLERAAEHDEDNEPAFALVMQATEVMMQKCGTARAATLVLRPEAPRPRPARPADGSVVVVEVGAEGGSVTLVGRPTGAAEWQFARITDDQSEALFGESGDGVVRVPALGTLQWVAGWEAGLPLLDRYPWVRLYPVRVHPEFVDQVRVAVEARLATLDASAAERARGKWERVFGLMASASS